MTRLLLPLAFLLAALANATPIYSTALACPAAPPPVALVDSGLSSLRTPLEVRYEPGPDGGTCYASLELLASALPSRSLVPRPRELAEELVPVAKAYGAKTCHVAVLVTDGTGASEDEDGCWRGEYRYGVGSWTEVEADHPCW